MYNCTSFITGIIIQLAKYPPSAGFPSPSGGVAPSVPPLGAFCTHVGAPPVPILETATFGGGKRQKDKKNLGQKKKIGAKKKKIGAKKY